MNIMSNTWPDMELGAAMQKTYCWEITSYWNIRQKVTSSDELPWVATRAGRILTIVFALRDETVRPITGWVADKKRRRFI